MIKILFLFFFLLNAVFFYTQFVAGNETTSASMLKPLPLPPGVDRLVLLRENGLGEGNASLSEKKSDAPLVQENTSTSSVKPAAPPAETSAKRTGTQPEEEARKLHESACFTLGPFVRDDVVKRRSGELVALGIDVRPREVSRRTPRGYWVYLPASNSYQAAKRKVTELQKKGLKDLFIMGKGNHKNAISLGLFTHEDAANSRFQQVKKLGLRAVLEIQYRVSKQTWLDMTLPDGQVATVAASITEMADGSPRMRLEQRKCL